MENGMEESVAAKGNESEIESKGKGVVAGVSLRDRIKHSCDIRHEDVAIPEWDNCVVRVTSMSGKERAAGFEYYLDKKGEVDRARFIGYLVVACCTDPATGEKVFGFDDIDWLMEKSTGPIEKLADAARKVSGLGEMAVVDAEKN